MMTPSEIYTLRTTNLLALPALVQDIIATMQLTPVAQIYSKKSTFKKPTAGASASWRAEALTTMKIKHDDPDFESVVGITNKVAGATVVKRANEIFEIIKKRADDQVFRLRIVALLFDRGVSMPFYSKLVAKMFEILHSNLPIIKEDLQFSCSIDIFEKMFDQSETVVCPLPSDPEYHDNLCKWMKKKEIRRGFGMFVTELHIRGLVDDDVIVTAIRSASLELEEMVRKPTDKSVAESVDQLVTLLYETCKVITTRYGKEHPIVKMMTTRSTELRAIPKLDAPCLTMRSRFKLEDINKL